MVHGPEIYDFAWEGGAPRDPRQPSTLDSAGHTAWGVVVDSAFTAYGTRPRHSWDTTVIYEAHVRGLTRLLPGLPEHLRGTYAGLAHPYTISHLKRLGITALELLPVHAKMAEPALTARERTTTGGTTPSPSSPRSPPTRRRTRAPRAGPPSSPSSRAWCTCCTRPASR